MARKCGERSRSARLVNRGSWETTTIFFIRLQGQAAGFIPARLELIQDLQDIGLRQGKELEGRRMDGGHQGITGKTEPPRAHQDVRKMDDRRLQGRSARSDPGYGGIGSHPRDSAESATSPRATCRRAAWVSWNTPRSASKIGIRWDAA